MRRVQLAFRIGAVAVLSIGASACAGLDEPPAAAACVDFWNSAATEDQRREVSAGSADEVIVTPISHWDGEIPTADCVLEFRAAGSSITKQVVSGDYTGEVWMGRTTNYSFADAAVATLERRDGWDTARIEDDGALAGPSTTFAVTDGAIVSRGTES